MVRPFFLGAPSSTRSSSRSRNVGSGVRPWLSSPLQCCKIWPPLHHFSFVVEIKIGEDWKYEQDCVIDNSHPLLGIAQAEYEHIEDCGEEEDDEVDQGRHEGGLVERQWIGWLAKLPGEKIFNAEATPEHIQNIPERTSFFWYQDNIVHQALQSHVQAIGLDQNLND